MPLSKHGLKEKKMNIKFRLPRAAAASTQRSAAEVNEGGGGPQVVGMCTPQ
jgi:hypothetical protein